MEFLEGEETIDRHWTELRANGGMVMETLGPYRDCPGATRVACPRIFCRGSFDRVV
jgi:hypothetical protein